MMTTGRRKAHTAEGDKRQEKVSVRQKCSCWRHESQEQPLLLLLLVPPTVPHRDMHTTLPAARPATAAPCRQHMPLILNHNHTTNDAPTAPQHTHHATPAHTPTQRLYLHGLHARAHAWAEAVDKLLRVNHGHTRQLLLTTTSTGGQQQGAARETGGKQGVWRDSRREERREGRTHRVRQPHHALSLNTRRGYGLLQECCVWVCCGVC